MKVFATCVAVAASVVGLAILGHANVACDDAFEQPCRVTSETVLLEDSTITQAPALALTRAKRGATALWVHREFVDGGVPSADAGADGGDAGAPFPVIANFDVAVVDERGGLALAAKVPTPNALRRRRDSIEGMGVVVEDGAFLVHWIETLTTTDALGRIRRAASLKLAYSGQQDSIANLPSRASCEQCIVALTTVSLGSESILFLQIDRDGADDFGTLGVAGPPRSTFAAFRSRRDGTVTEEPIPWLTLPPFVIGDGGGIGGVGALRASNARGDIDTYLDAEGRIVVTSSGQVWLADTSLRLLSGPIVLPAARDARVSWDRASSSASASATEASIAWSVTPFEDGRSVNQVEPGEIFTGLVPPRGSVVATRERASRGRVLLSIDRRADDVGVLFESAGRTLFASLDAHGKKRGGDVLINGTSLAGTRSASEYGVPAVAEASLVFAKEDHRFGIVTLGSGKLVASEISCAP